MAEQKIITTTTPTWQHAKITTRAKPLLVDWHLEPFSSLMLIEEHDSAPTAVHEVIYNFYLQQGSSLHYVPILTGSSATTFTLNLHLAQQAHAYVAGAYVLRNNQPYTITTQQLHTGKAAKSVLAINGVAADQSLLNYAGTIGITKTAAQAFASQENKTVLWSQGARAFSVPALEVETNDVQCAHGSATGPLNEEHIRYIQSRGIDYQKAQELLLGSFFNQTLQELSDDRVRERIITRLIAHVLKKGPENE